MINTRVLSWRFFSAYAFVALLFAVVSRAEVPHTPEVLAQKSAVNWHALDTMDIHEDFLLIRYRGEVQPIASQGPAALRHLHTDIGAEVTKQYELIPWLVVRIPESVTLGEAALHYARDPAVSFVEPNFNVHLLETRPNDELYGDLWGMERIRAPEAWSLATESPDIVVAVIDTGVLYTHEDLADNMWVNPNPGPMDDIHGATFTGGGGGMTSGDPIDTNGHGTHVAGTIGAVGNNEVGVAGVTWNVQLMAIKFLDPGGTTADAISSVEYAILNGAHLSNNSWGGGGYNASLEEMIQRAAQSNQLFVAAAGNASNDNDASPFFPATYDVDNVLSVASLAEGGALSGFSNYGAETVHIAAPGSGILSAWHTSTNAYNSISGTSMASPHVAGAAALILGRAGPDMPYSELRAALLETARPNENVDGRVSSNGELDIGEAIKRAGASLSLNRRAYQSTAIAEVELFEPAIETNQVSAEVAWRLERDVEESPFVVTNGTLDVFRVAPDSPVFTNTINMVTIGAQEFDVLTVTYEDADGQVFTVAAPIDDTPPVIEDILLDQITEEGFTLSWTTDEPAISIAHVGTTVPPEDMTFQSSTYETNHVLRADGLESLTRYFALVSAEDYAGNRAYVPVEAEQTNTVAYIDAGLAALTRTARLTYEATFERGASDWEAETLFGQAMWEYGESHYGVPSRMRGWATVLHGDYPSSSHGRLTSPMVRTGARPVLELDHWWDIGYIRDAARLEARTKHGPWELLGTIRASRSGTWQTARIPLDASFAHKPIQVRMRFESDSRALNLDLMERNSPGWYVDAVRVTELLDTGLVLANLQISDEDEGDADGYPEPGDIITIQPVLANFSEFARNGIAGTVSVISSGGHDPAAFFPDGEDAVLTFDDLPALELVTANEPMRISIPDTMHPESTFSLVFVLEDDEGRRTELAYDIAVEPRVSLHGRLVDADGDPINGVTVEMRRGAQTFTAVSDTDGMFSVHGLLQRTTYTLEAGDQIRRVVMPMDDWHDYELVLYGGPDFEGLEDEASYVGTGSGTIPELPFAEMEDAVLVPETESIDSGEPVVQGSTTVTGVVTVAKWSQDLATSTIQPVSNATVIVENLNGAQVASADTDALGAYSLSNIPDGPLWFRVVAPPEPEPPEDDDDDNGDDNGDDDDDDDDDDDGDNGDDNGDDNGGDDDEEDPLPPHPWYVTPSGRTVQVGTVETDESVDFQFDDYGFNVPYLQALAPVLLDEGLNEIEDGLLERGTNYVVRFRLRNTGATVSLNTTGTLATAWMGIDDIMTVTQSNAWQSVDIYENGPVRYLKPAFEVKVHTNAPKGALQRFSVVVEGTNPIAGTTLAWPFDFSLRADNRVAVHSQVVFTDEPISGAERAARMQETRVRLTLDGESMTRRPNPDGTFVFRGPMVQLGASGTIEIMRLPEGFVLPDSVDIPAITDDVHVTFMVDPLDIDVTPEDEVHVEIHEGQSTNVSFMVRNDTLDERTFDLAVRYHRRQNAVQAAEPVMSVQGSADTDAANDVSSMGTTSADVQETDELVVRFAEGTSREDQASLLASAGLEAVFYFSSFPAALARPVSVPDDMFGVASSPADIEQDPRVLAIVPDTVAEPYGLPEPNDPRFGQMYALENRRQTGGTIGMDIRAREAWAHTTGSRDVVVGVADTGILRYHPDLTDNIWENPSPGSSADIDGDINGWNFFEWNHNVDDNDIFTSGHGTHVAGTIGAVGDNNEGITGVAWDTQLMVLRLTGDFGIFTTSARIARSIEYAAEQGAQVSNHSWGGPDTAGVIRDAILFAKTQDHLVIAAAGNAGQDLEKKRAYPAGYGGQLDNVITVAASDHHGELASFSNFGKTRVQLAAPGVNILSTWSEFGIFPDYLAISGTSMAAPHVTGVAALLWSLDPEAPYGAVRDAILQGVRKDPRLTGWVQTGGHLDAGRAVRAFGANWLAFDPQQITLGPGDEAEISLTINDPAVLQALSEDYEATIMLHATDNAVEAVHVPVRVTVHPHVWVAYEGVRIENENDWPDGLAASPGDRVSLWVSLRNRGSGAASQLSGVLRDTNGVVVVEGQADWPMLYSSRTEETEDPFVIEIGDTATGDVTLALDIYHGDVLLETVSITVPVLVGHHASGQVVDMQGAGVPARVEAAGARGAATLAREDGNFVLRGLVDGDYQLRIIPAEHTRLTDDFAIAGDDADLGMFAVSYAAGVPGTNRVETDGMLGGQAVRTLTLVNDDQDVPFAYSVQPVPMRRIALVSDGEALAHLVAPLEQMGFRVSHYTENFVRRQVYIHSLNAHAVEQTVRWTNQDTIFGGYDAILADLTGPDGNGRLMTFRENMVLRNFMDRGGLVIFTGRNPLSIPDNHALADLMGINTLDRTADLSGAQVVSKRIFESPFLTLQADDQVAGRSLRYDVASQYTSLSRVEFETELANKLVTRRRGAGLGYIWTGNHGAADWQEPGIWLDVLRGLLWNALYADTGHETSWIGLQDGAGGVTNLFHGMIPAGGENEIGIELQAGYPSRPEMQEAVLVILGAAAGTDIKAVQVDFSIGDPVLRVFTSGVVTDWRNAPLKGDGGSDSARYQVVLTGQDGAIAEPRPDGSPGPGNALLTAQVGGVLYGRFGAGAVPAHAGKFSQLFRLPVDHAGRQVFVRAWDSSTFDASIAYGDSSAVVLDHIEDAMHDFGSWGVTNVLHPDRDSNFNSIPDGWIIENALHLDPREPVGALENRGIFKGQMQIPDGRANADPRRVVVQDPYVFVLDTDNHRLMVLHTNQFDNHTGPAEIVAELGVVGGHPGSELGAFNTPYGLALDPRPDMHRLAVADTRNHRIQLIDFDPETGVLTPVRALGSQGSGDGQLVRPRGVAIMPNNGDVFVADTKNNRVQSFRQNGNFLFGFSGGSQYAMHEPHGIAVDPDYGIFIADTQNHRILRFGFGGTGLQIIGAYGEADGQFARPTDIRIWRHEVLHGDDAGQFRRRLVITDQLNNRVQLHAMDGTHLLRIGKQGLQPGELRLPYGAFPVESSPYLYVADTDNRRIQHFRVVLDADGDGMDDFWEDMHGFDSSDPDDAMEYSDEPGLESLRNIAIYLVYEIAGENLLLDPEAEIPFTIVDQVDAGAPMVLHIQRSGPLGGAGSSEDPPQVELMWETVVGRQYRIERTSALGESWETVLTHIATDSISSVALTLYEERGFYRIVLEE